MRLLATLALFGLWAGLPVAAQTVGFANLNNGAVNVRIYNNGIVGDNCSETIGFAFNNDNGLCGAGFLWGISSSTVIGDAYLTNTNTGWTPLAAVTNATSSPYPALPQGVTTSFRNAANNITVALGAYTAANAPYVVFRYDITNTGASPAVGYPGLFADWDVGVAAYATNLAVADAATSTLYAWDPTGASVNYFGTTLISHPMTGWRFSTPYPAAAGVPHARADFWQGLTTAEGATATEQDQRFVQGHGPVTIPAGGTITFAVAYVAGGNLAAFQANVLAARANGAVSAEEAPTAASRALSAPRPNPASTSTDVTLSVEQSQVVRVALYDALGREVAVLLDAAVAAGADQTLRVATAGLPAGLYVVRAQGETFTAQRLLSVVR